MAKQVPRGVEPTEDDYAEVAADMIEVPIEIAVEVLGVEEQEFFSDVEDEEDIPAPIANPKRVRAGDGGGIVTARSSRRP